MSFKLVFNAVFQQSRIPYCLILISTILFSFNIDALHAQTDRTSIYLGADTIANINLDSSSKFHIPVIEYKFSKPVTQFFEDPEQGLFYLNFSTIGGKDYQSAIDPELSLVKWEKKVNWKTVFSKLDNRYFKAQYPKRQVIIDMTTGEQLWDMGKSEKFISNERQLVIKSFRQSRKHKHEVLKALDLRTGKKIWKRKIKNLVEWQDTYELNDSTLIIAGMGIQAINYNTGKGWSIDIQDNTDYKSRNTITSKRSNILLDINTPHLYFHANEFLLKFDTAGNVTWTKELPAHTSDRIEIWQDSTHLYLYSYGPIWKIDNNGLAYFACVEKETGNTLSSGVISNPISSVTRLGNSNILGISKTEVLLINLKEGSIEQSWPKPKKPFIRFKNIDRTNYYVKTGEKFVIAEFGIDYQWIDIAQTLHMDRSTLLIQKTAQLFHKLELKESKLYLYHNANADHAYFTDGFGHILARIGPIKGTQYLNGNLYSLNPKRIIKYNLDSFIHLD